MGFDPISLALSKNYTAETVEGMGAIKGDKGDPGPTGPAGVDGATGPTGPAGNDGFSPTVSVTDITGGHRVTITDADGPQTFDVMDGTGGSGADIYSLEEQEVGRWIDGKPIYEKVFVIDTTIPAMKEWTVLVSLDPYSVDVLFSPIAFFREHFENNYTQYFGSGGFFIQRYKDILQYRQDWTSSFVGHPWTVTLRLQYTKTTDQPTIELPAALTAAPAQAAYKAASQSTAAVTLDTRIKNEEV